VRFVDTNVLLYAVSTARSESAKTRRAAQILADADVCLSVQVLQEFYVQATRASRPERLTHDQASRLVESLLRFPTVEISTSLLRAALALAHRFQISYWDAAILEAGRALGADVVWSEDLADERDYGGVRVQNPFR
jgi:predicted nucleic acid-binding protein